MAEKRPAAKGNSQDVRADNRGYAEKRSSGAPDMVYPGTPR